MCLSSIFFPFITCAFVRVYLFVMLKKTLYTIFSLMSHKMAVIYAHLELKLIQCYFCIKLMYSKESYVCNSNKMLPK